MVEDTQSRTPGPNKTAKTLPPVFKESILRFSRRTMRSAPATAEAVHCRQTRALVKLAIAVAPSASYAWKT